MIALRAELAERTGRTSVPNIFIAGEGIGGCNDGPGLLTLQKEGKLGKTFLFLLFLLRFKLCFTDI